MSLHMLGLSSDKTNLGMLDQKRSTYPYIIIMVFLTITYAFLQLERITRIKSMLAIKERMTT